MAVKGQDRNRRGSRGSMNTRRFDEQILHLEHDKS